MPKIKRLDKKAQKQHYVPEVYLNNFSFDQNGNLYSIRINSTSHKLKVKKVNKSQVCYKPDNYKFHKTDIKDENEIADPNYIENNLFNYENEFIRTITNKINSKQNVNLLDAENLIRVILSIKFRNQAMKELFQVPEMKEHIERAIEELKNHTIMDKFENPKKHDALIKIIGEELRYRSTDESSTSDIYNEQLLKTEEKQRREHEWLIKDLSKCRFNVFCTEESKPFLTSDNPGYTVHPGGLIGNLHFGSAMALAFPISKTRMFFITYNNRDGNELIIKKINYKNTSDESLKEFNSATIINATEKIFSNSSEYLDELIRNFDFKHYKYKN